MDEFWPPTLAELKADMRVDSDRFDAALQITLDAAVTYVERVRSDVDYPAAARAPEEPTDPDLTKVAVSKDLKLGTLRYARRLDIRRDSPSGMVVTDQIGATPVAGWDADIEKLLRVGRYAKLRFA